MPVTGTALPIRLFVDDITGIIALYNRIKVYRSTGNQAGPWVEIAGTATAGSVIGYGDQEPYALNGKTLELQVNSLVDVTVTFVGADPFTAAAAAAEITAAMGAAGSASDVSGQVKISSASTGTASSIEITGGTGYIDLGFQLGDYGLGTDAAITLVAGQKDYSYTDYNGDSSYWYRTRYYNSSSGISSEYTVAFEAHPVPALPSTSMITGTCYLVDLSGRALPNQPIHIYNLFEPSMSGTYGVFGLHRVVVTDDDGYAAVSLVRGSLVEVTWPGTSVRRRIRVPSSGTSFSLLDSTLADDEFGIHVPVIVEAERRSP